MYIQIILNLLLVIGLICVYMFITWKLKGIKSSKNQLIEVISVLGIGAKEKIMILKVDGKRILVGTTASNISVLANLDSTLTQTTDVRKNHHFTEVLQEAVDKSILDRNMQ